MAETESCVSKTGKKENVQAWIFLEVQQLNSKYNFFLKGYRFGTVSVTLRRNSCDSSGFVRTWLIFNDKLDTGS